MTNTPSSDAGDVVTENANEGTDRVNAMVSYTLGANIEDLYLLGSNSINGTGNGFDNDIWGNSGANILDGGIGADTMTGGGGNDQYYVDNLGDVVTELADEGTDTVHSAIGYTLGAHVEHLHLTAALAQSTAPATASTTTSTATAASTCSPAATATIVSMAVAAPTP